MGPRAAELARGEILLNSMDADGTNAGYDLEMLAAVRSRCAPVPLIAGGGAGRAGALLAAARSRGGRGAGGDVFHFGGLRIDQVKDALRAAGHPVR